MATVLDTLQAAKDLEAADIPAKQAEAITRLWKQGREADLAQLATKADLAVLRSDLTQMEARLDTKIAEAKFDLLKWVVPLLAAQLVALVGLFFKA